MRQGGAAAFPFVSIFLADTWGNAAYSAENAYYQDNLAAATAGKGPHIQIEQSIDSQWGTPVGEDPFSINATNQTIAHRYDCGTGQSSTSGMYGCTSAMDIVTNPETFENGIVVGNGAIDTGGGTREGNAISLPVMTGITWYSAASTYSATEYSPSAGIYAFSVPSGGQFRYYVNGTEQVGIAAGEMFPATNGGVNLGDSSRLYGAIYGGQFDMAAPLAINTAPTISSGFGTGPTIQTPNGTAAFVVHVGSSPGATGVLTLPAASNGWVCDAIDLSQQNATQFYVRETAETSTSVTLTMFAASGSSSAFVAGDFLAVKCTGF